MQIKIDGLAKEGDGVGRASDGNMFPHLYSSLDVSSIINEFEIILEEDGNHRLPDNF